MLESFEYWYFNETGSPATVVTSLYAWNGSASTGAALFTGTSGLASAFTYAGIDYTDIAASLVPGAQYIMSSVANDNNVTMVTDYHGGASSRQYYEVEDYNGTYSNLNSNSLDFTATFDAGGVIAPVPEMNSLEWAGSGRVRGRYSPVAAIVAILGECPLCGNPRSSSPANERLWRGPRPSPRLAKLGVSDDLYQSALAAYSEKELSALTFAVMAINAWNRLNIAFRKVPGSADAAFGLLQANVQ